MAAAAWLFRYRPVSDPSDVLLGQNAVMSVSFVHQDLEEPDRFLSALPDGALAIYDQRREDIGPRTLVTLYAHPGETGLAWSIDLRDQLRSPLRWVRRNVDGFGFLTQGVDELEGTDDYFPFEFNIKDGVARLSAGRHPVGLSNHLGEDLQPTPLRLRGLVPDIYDIYYYRPEDAASPISLKESGLLNVVQAEIVYKERSATSTSFIVHGLAEDATATRTTYLQALKAYVGLIEPANIKKVLPDGSTYVEKRDGTDFVQETTKNLNVGTLTYLKGFEQKRGLVLFEERGGEYWVAPDLDTVQAGLTMGVTPSTLPESCLPRGKRPGFIFSPASQTAVPVGSPWILDWMRGFKAVSLVVEDQESGLFTLCGKLP